MNLNETIIVSADQPPPEDEEEGQPPQDPRRPSDASPLAQALPPQQQSGQLSTPKSSVVNEYEVHLLLLLKRNRFLIFFI